MISSISSNLSALMAYGKKMGVHANNVANMNSEGFQKSRAILTENPEQHVSVEIERIASPEYPISETADSQGITGEPDNNVDLATEITETIITQNGYEANTVMIKAEDELVGTILDLLS